jgi:hypothetical protein
MSVIKNGGDWSKLPQTLLLSAEQDILISGAKK